MPCMPTGAGSAQVLQECRPMAAKSPSQHPRQVVALQQVLWQVPHQDPVLPPCCMVHCSNGLQAVPVVALLNLLVT